MDVPARAIHRDAENWRRIGELLAQDINVVHLIRPLASPINQPELLQPAPIGLRIVPSYSIKVGRFTT